MNHSTALFPLLILTLPAAFASAEPVASPLPEPRRVENVSVALKPGEPKTLDIFYDLEGADSKVVAAYSLDGGASLRLFAPSAFSGDVGAVVKPGRRKHAIWRPSAEEPLAKLAGGKMVMLPMFRSSCGDFVLIPAGNYTIGDLAGDPDIVGHNHPHPATPTPVQLTGYYIATTETTKQQWDAVREWGTAHGYPELPVGIAKGADEPIRGASWYHAVMWCNAASERDGLRPCYYAKEGEVYRAGNVDDVLCDWKANGYRLPTEAEWEVAARGGLSGKRFPWGDTITHTAANYNSLDKFAYDVSPTRGPHPSTASKQWAGFSPVGSFPANGYGLFDMAGNAFEWCWDWYGAYAPGQDPKGVYCTDTAVHWAVRFSRVLRGGDCGKEATYARNAYRHSSVPGRASPNIGFRLVRVAAPSTPVALPQTALSGTQNRSPQTRP
ncbi:MAG: hypothetical protein RLZZ399_1490 [Verrucomicrobiota bacterium]|jgi:formylglycine-generating enzyme required for sulfatase activity